MITLVRSSPLYKLPPGAEPTPPRYELQELIGRGGMGDVFAAWDHELHRSVAVKVLRNADSDPRQVRRLLREARISAGLSHPAVVRVFDTGVQPDGRAFLVMERVDGVPLNAIPRPVEPLVVARWLAPVCDALHEAHQAGVVHRDIKPPNLLLQSSHGLNRVRVLDFGVAHIQSAEASITRDGQFIGTALYCAPEQAEGSEVGPETDIYALGVVMFELLTGELPFAGSTAAATLYLHVHRPAPDVRSLAPHVPESLARLVADCLAKSPRDRPASARAVADELRSLLGDPRYEPSPVRVPRAESDLAHDDTLMQTADLLLDGSQRHADETDTAHGKGAPSPGRLLKGVTEVPRILASVALVAAVAVASAFQLASDVPDTRATANSPAPLEHPVVASTEHADLVMPTQQDAEAAARKSAVAEARDAASRIGADARAAASQTAAARASANPMRRRPRASDDGAALVAPPLATRTEGVDVLRAELRALQEQSVPSRDSTDALRDELRLLRATTP